MRLQPAPARAVVRQESNLMPSDSTTARTRDSVQVSPRLARTGWVVGEPWHHHELVVL